MLLAVLVTACSGGNGNAASQTTIQLRPTNYVTLPVVTTTPSTTTIPGQPPPDDGTNGDTYTVQNGDTVSGIARRHNVTAEDIADYNGWSDGVTHLIYQGMEIKIPPFAEDDSEEEPDNGRSSGGDPLDSLPDIEPNGAPLCPGGTQREVYEVESGDFPNRVATELEIPLEDLEAANESNPTWSSFMIGENLWLPCEEEDFSTASTATETTE